MTAAPADPEVRIRWITRPWIDLLIGCGGWSAPVLVVAYLLVDSNADAAAVAFYALALVCNYPHYMATIHRAYGRLEDRQTYRVFTHHLTAGLMAVAVAAHVWPTLLPWVFTAYVMWSPWHYAGQNFGLSMMFLRRAGIVVSRDERRGLHAAFIASFVLLLAAFNEGASSDRVVLSIGLPTSVAWPIQLSAAIVFASASTLAFVSVARRAPWRTLLPALTLLSTQALWFVVPVVMARWSQVPSPQLRYSTGVLALMHSAQYLWITQHYARRDSARAGAAGWHPWRYATFLVLGGIALFMPAPWAASLVGHWDFTSSALIVAAIVNLHHFMLDGVVWKLRDRRVSAALVDGDESSSTIAPTGVAGSGHSLSRRLLWATAAIALVVLALVDEARYVLSSRSLDRAALETARGLNPHDSRVHLKLATVARRSGARDSAERALTEAIVANPADIAARQAMVRLLVEDDRMTEAAAANRALLAMRPGDVDALVNAGVLAQREGDVDGAAQWWRQALTRADDRADVHLYLAEMLDAAARPGEALPHYQRHLELVVAARDTNPDGRRVALVVVKFADALWRTGHREQALAQYQLAAQIARATGHADIEAMVAARGEPAIAAR